MSIYKRIVLLLVVQLMALPTLFAQIAELNAPAGMTNYQWYIHTADGIEAIANETSAQLGVSNPGIYFAEYEGNNCGDVTDYFILTPAEGDDTEVLLNAPTGHSYQWFADGSEIAGETGALLSLTAAEDAVEYYAETTHSSGKVTETSAFTVMRIGGIDASIVATDFACSESIATYHTFFTNNSSVATTISIKDTLPAGFVFLHDTLIFDQGGSSDFVQQPVEGATGVIQWGTISLESGETMNLSYDVYFNGNLVNGQFSNNMVVASSTEGLSVFPSSLTASMVVGDCPTPDPYTCEPAFYQVYKKKGKNSPNLYGKLDPITGDYDQIAVASTHANGLGFDINTGLVFGASGNRFIELDADGVVIDKGLRFNKSVFRGDINDNSEWYGVDGSDMVVIDVSGTPVVTATYAGEGLSGWDIAYNKDGHFYSITSNEKLQRFNTTTHQKEVLGTVTGPNLPESGGYGAQWTGSDGYLYASHNSSGSIIRIDTETLEGRVVSSSIDGLRLNDGFSCPISIPAVYEFDYGDNSALPQYRILSYKQDLSTDNLPDYNMVWPGSTVNYDTSDPSTPNADGDLDDGFGMTTEIVNGTLNTQFNLNTNIDTTAYYSIAIDWDDNGTLDSLLIKSVSISEPIGVNETIFVPAGFIDGYINVRVVASEAELTSENLEGDNLNMGEVEDYRFFITNLCDGCEVGTGFDGGLESNGGIAAAIAKRNYMRKVTNENRHLKPNQMTRRSFQSLRTASSNDLSDYLPESGYTGNEEATVSTPEDLVELTNAIEVFAQDFYLSDKRVVGALALKTENEVYDHAKIICDRLNGRKIEKVQLIDVGGFKMLYATITYEGNVEHSAWFSAKTDEETYHIQSRWNIDGYEEGDYLNFQVWSSDSRQVFYILGYILDQLKLSKEVVQDASEYQIPGIFVQSGSYQDGKLVMDIFNLSGTDEAVINASIRKTETTYFEEVSYEVGLSGDRYEQVIVETGYLFDVGLSVYDTGNEAYDEMYLADGAWGTDFDESKSSIRFFQILPEDNDPIENIARVERGFELDGRSSDVINVFRNLKGGDQSLDVPAYSAIIMDISNSTPIEVVLVEEELSNWEDRKRITISAKDYTSRVVIPLEEFSKGEELGKIKTVVFSYLNASGTSEDIKLEVSNVFFGDEQSIVTGIGDEIDANVTVYPNPVDDKLNVSFEGKAGQVFSMELVDITGKIILSKNGKMTGNQFDTTLYSRNLEQGIYLMKIQVGETTSTKRIFVK